MSLGKNERQRIYKHTMLNQADADRFKGLFESAYAEELNRFNHGNRQKIAQERVRFATEQFANRRRIANVQGIGALYEDANIFGGAFPQLKNLFESVSSPNNIIGMGEVRNPMAGNLVPGGMNNPNYQPGSGDVPTYQFGLQGQLAMACQAFDLVPTIAVDTPKVVITFVDTVYGGGKFNEEGSKPSFIEIACPAFTRNWIRGTKLVRAKSRVIIASSDNKNAMEVTFILGSTIKAAITAHVEKVGKFDGTNKVEPATESDEAKTVMVVFEAINKGTAALKIFVSPDGTADAYADQAKSFVWTEATNSWTGTAKEFKRIDVDYASATRTNIAEASVNNWKEDAKNRVNGNSRGMSRAEHERGPKHKLNVVMMDKQLEMVGIEIEADTNNIEIKDMAAAGVNVIAMLYAGVQNQLVQTLDEIVLEELYRLGVQHAVNVYEATGINHSIYIGPLGTANESIKVKDIDVTFEDILGNDVRERMGSIPNAILSSSYENQQTHANRLYSRLLVTAEFIHQQNREEAPDFLVAAGEICACLKHNSRYSVCPVNTNLSGKSELYYTGTIFENIYVYKNVKADFNDPRILLGVRGDDKSPGLKLLAYDLAASRATIAEDTMSDKIRVWSRFALASVGFYPELRYYTMLAINKFQWA